MNNFTQNFVIGATALMLSFTFVTSAVSQSATKKTLQTKEARGVIVRGAVEFRRLLSSRKGNKQAIVISCRPVSAEWCSGGFITGCIRNNGVGSSDPDGGYVCTIPDAD